MKVAILGTRGIPNNYGGFEQFAEFLAVGLVKKGISVTVYNPHFHNYNNSIYKGIEVKKIYSPEKYLGAFANFIYDYLCLKDALKNDYDIIYECGYQSASISYSLLNTNKSRIITNMDGLEWKRDKWNYLVKKITLFAEKIGVEKSHYLIADNLGIQNYIQKKYKKPSDFIPYGALEFKEPNSMILKKFNIKPQQYYLNIARLEPENNIETIINGYLLAKQNYPLIIVGNVKTKYGKFLLKKYSSNNNVIFVGSIYNNEIINNLRFFSMLYFHGHSVGGTNPALLEAMAAKCLIAAHKNEFNESVLGKSAFYFTSKIDIQKILLSNEIIKEYKEKYICENLDKINKVYSWENITEQYYNYFNKIIFIQ